MSRRAIGEEDRAEEGVAGAGFQKAIELAAELRAVAQELTEREVDAADADAAIEALRRVRGNLLGARRPRWYETPAAAGSDAPGHSPFDTLSPVRGLLNPVAPPLRIEPGVRRDGTPCMVGEARLPSLYEGPPRGVHGGIVAAMFDEILGGAQGLAPPPGVTAKLEVDYHHLTPVEEDLRLEAWVVEERGRRVRAEATCHAGETLTARARALFVRVDFEATHRRMKARAEAL